MSYPGTRVPGYPGTRGSFSQDAEMGETNVIDNDIDIDIVMSLTLSISYVHTRGTRYQGTGTERQT